MRLILLRFILVFASYRAEAQWTNPVLLPGTINDNPPGSHYYSAISADGQVLCLTVFPGFYGDDDVYISERLADSTWSVPVNAGPNVNNVQRNLSPSITNDRQRLYYVSWTGSYDLMVSYRTGPDWDDWSPGVPLPVPINRGWEFTGMITADDSTLLFTSTGQPGQWQGEMYMYTGRLQPDGSWSEPVVLAPHLNDWDAVYHPCLTDSGNTLLYSRWIGFNLEIFYAMRNDTGFGPEIRLDSTINSPYWDSGPSAPWDGSCFIFDSRREHAPSGASWLHVAPRVLPVPQHLVVIRVGPDIQLSWNPVMSSDVSYQIWSDSTSVGTFETLAGFTSDTCWVDVGVFEQPVTQKFYVVRAIRP